MQSLDFKDVSAPLELTHPPVDPGKTSVFSILGNEMHFAPAFPDHRRGIRVRQFIVVDNGSADGATDYPDMQPDCIRSRSVPRDGGEIEVRAPRGKRKKTRAGDDVGQMCERLAEVMRRRRA